MVNIFIFYCRNEVKEKCIFALHTVLNRLKGNPVENRSYPRSCKFYIVLITPPATVPSIRDGKAMIKTEQARRPAACNNS